MSQDEARFFQTVDTCNFANIYSVAANWNSGPAAWYVFRWIYETKIEPVIEGIFAIVMDLFIPLTANDDYKD